MIPSILQISERSGTGSSPRSIIQVPKGKMQKAFLVFATLFSALQMASYNIDASS
jgi:hypothetical protein